MATKKTFQIKKRPNAIKRKLRSVEINCAAGCDVDKDAVVIAIAKRGDREIQSYIFEQSRKGRADAIKYLLDNQVELVILESTGSYHNYFYDGFIENGINAKVINPLLIKALIKTNGKDDSKDAMLMAELALNFPLKSSNMPDAKMKRIRLHFRTLDQIKKQKTSVTNRLHATLRQYSIQIFREVKITSMSGLGIMNGIANGLQPLKNLEENFFGAKKKIEDLLQLFPNNEPLPFEVRQHIQDELCEVLRLQERIDSFDEKTEKLIADLELEEIINIIITHPAMNKKLALLILGEMGIDFVFRYPSKEKFVSALGLVPKNIISGGKLIKRESTHGNILSKIEIINHVKPMCVGRGRENDLKDFYKFYSSQSNKNFMKAISAVCRKLMEAIYANVRDMKPYRPKAICIQEFNERRELEKQQKGE